MVVGQRGVCTHSRQARGFTLAELLIVVVILGIVAAAAVPMFSSFLAAQKLEVAAEEVANLLRLAESEARRTGGYVLVDGASNPGRLALYVSNSNGDAPPTAGTAAIVDPLTRRAASLDVTGSSFSGGVVLAAGFIGNTDNQPWPCLLIGPGLSQLQSAKKVSDLKGPLVAGSGVVLTLGSRSLTVAINEVTGLVTLP